MTYPGGKAGSGVYQQIINQIPRHATYIEPFLGGGAIMRLKRPAGVSNIGIDIDAESLENFSQQYSNKIPHLELLNCSAMEFLAHWPSAKFYFHSKQHSTFIYLDPPYLMSTRSTQRQIYKHEFSSEAEHEELLKLITSFKCMVAVSGYWSELYADRLNGWRFIQFPAMTRSGAIATETLWMNFPVPLEIHDYRYLGQNFRERERINRKKRRWSERLKTMDPQERHAILAAIDELRYGSDIA